MEKLNELRWERLKSINLSYEYIKNIIKLKYNYEVKERNMDEFIKNISNYKTLIESELLIFLEKYSYEKLSIFSIKKSERQKEYPIRDELTSPINKMLFNQKNRIKLNGGESEFTYDGCLDNCYKVVYYCEDENKIEIKLACLKNFTYEESDQSTGVVEEINEELYDCAKFIINMDKNIVLMFYNDNSKIIPNLVTAKKSAFQKLFSDVNQSNLLKYNLSKYLGDYYKEYLKEIENNDTRKLISIISTKSVFGNSNAIKSISDNYVHNKLRLEAITHAIEHENHIIHTIECVLNGSVIRFKHSGDISLEDSIFKEEVVENVYKEFFPT